MDAIEISYRLKKIGLTQSAVANQLGVGDAAVSDTIHRRITSNRIAHFISDNLDLPFKAVWPDYKKAA